MPLIQGKSRAAIGQNIKTELAANRPKKQAVAIALNVARKAGAKLPPPPAAGPKRRPKRSLGDMMDGD